MDNFFTENSNPDNFKGENSMDPSMRNFKLSNTLADTPETALNGQEFASYYENIFRFIGSSARKTKSLSFRDYESLVAYKRKSMRMKDSAASSGRAGVE